MCSKGRIGVLALALAIVPALALGQGSAATLSGVVQDKDGKIPGVTVVVKDTKTGETQPAKTTNSEGVFSFPGLPAGTYTVTISFPGFKTVQVETRLAGGTTNALPPVTLEVGSIMEVVNVVGSSELVRTDTPTVTQTINSNFVSTLPRVDRNAINFLVFLPGVQMTGGQADDGARFNTSIVGFSNSNIRITIDGVTTSSLLDNQGMFAMITPRLDAVEEVSLTTASAGADATGQGAVQVRVVTRSGTNQLQLSLYWYQQHAKLNSNTFFNRLDGNPVPVATNYTYGGRVGGPIVLPGFDGRGKAFFFFNQEELHNPFEVGINRTVISDAAFAGNYTYGPQGGQTTRNVLAIAAANGQVSTYDPVVKNLLEKIRETTFNTGRRTSVVTSPNTDAYNFLAATKNVNHAPTTNITVNLSPKHRLQGSYYWIRFTRVPDNLNGQWPGFPGFPGYGNADQYRTLGSASLRSTLSTSLVNEARGGWQWAPVGFNTNGEPSMFDIEGGYRLGGLAFSSSPSAGGPQQPNKRNTANWTISDQLNWLKGEHSVTFGGDFRRIDDYNQLTQNATSLTLGFTTSFDPAEAMFNTTNFPGSTSGDRNNAKALYALLTGRVASITGTGRLNNDGTQYAYNGPSFRRETQDDYSFYVQDQWRWKPTVTITAGLRYQFTLPVTSRVGNFTTISMSDSCGISGLGEGPGGRLCNMFNGGNLTGPGLADIRNPGVQPMYVAYTSDTKGYDTDLNNFAPNVGIAWRPNVQDGWLRALLGDPELATINGGWSRSFTQTQLTNYISVYNGNPGQSISLTRSSATGAAFPLVDTSKGETWPILYRQTDRLGPPAFNPNPVLPIPASFSVGAWVFDPRIQVPYSDSWNVSIQRSLTKDTVVEFRYQGNRSWGAWSQEDWNTTNVYETSWLNGRDGFGVPNGEFEKAMGNLRANVLADRAGDGFRYTGIPGTQPLPVILAHFNGSTDASNPAAYTGNIWTSSNYVPLLDPYTNQSRTFAGRLYINTETSVAPGVQQRLFTNAMNVGYPQNYWKLNPALETVNVYTNSDNRPSNHFVILQMRRRLAAGLAAQASYTWARSFSGSLQDYHLDRFYLRNTGIPHAIQGLFSYDVPFGRGKRYGANINPWLDGVAGGWTFSGTVRFQTQSFVLRNAVLVGMSLKEAQKELSHIRFVTDPVSGAVSVFNFPVDIYTNTRLAYATDETSKTFYATNAAGVYTGPEGPLAMATPDGRYRYFKPAGGLMPDGSLCNIVYPGDCGTQELWFRGRWFGEMDFRLAKAFQLPGRARFEFSAEVFNVAKALNFPNVINPGTGGGTFEIDETQSGARTAQLVWRVTW